MRKRYILLYVVLCIATVLLSAVAGVWTAMQMVRQEYASILQQTQPTMETAQCDHSEPEEATEAKQEPEPTPIPIVEGNVAAIARKCAASVVSITTKEVQRGYTGGSSVSEEVISHGTGVIVSQDGYIVTCHHVIEGADEIVIRLDDRTELTAELIGADEQFDLAVIKVHAEALPAAELGMSDAVTTGEQVVVIGNPLGEFGSSVSAGVLSAPERELTISGVPLRLMQTDAAVNPGNSGGGLFNMRGQLIGIVNAKISASGIEGIGFAIPINTIWSRVEAFIDGTTIIEKAYLGVSTKKATCVVNAKTTECVQIVTVHEDSPAQIAGLQENDYLISAAGQPIKSNDDLTLAIKYRAPGDTVEFQIWRNNEQITVTVVLGAN